MKIEEIPMISYEAGLFIVLLLVVAAGIGIVKAMLSDYRERWGVQRVRRYSFSDFIKRERFYIYLYLFFLFIIGHGMWFCYHLRMFHV